MPEKLTQEQLQALAARFGLETAVLQSLAETASETDAFLPDGRASLFFEGHLFYRNLEKAGISPDTCRAGNENILFREPTIRYDEGGAREYARLDKARTIPLLRAHDWPAFSHRYTGSSLAPDDLAWKMGQAYYRHTARNGNRPGYR